MRTLGLTAVFLVGGNLCLADISDKPERRVGPPILVAEAGASCCVGNLLALGVPALISIACETPSQNIPISVLLGYPVIYPFASAYSIDVTGKTCRQRGSFWGAVGGGAVGMICSGLMFVSMPTVSEFKPISVAAFVIVPPVLSVTGYNVLGHTGTRRDGVTDEKDGQVLYGTHSLRYDMPRGSSIRVRLLEMNF